MTRRYTLLDLLRDVPRSRETLSYRDLTLCRRARDDGRYNVADAAGERLVVLDVDDFESEGALQRRLDDLSATADTDPAVIEPSPSPQLVADGGTLAAFDAGTLRDVGTELWPFGPFGTVISGTAAILVGVGQLLPAGNFLAVLVGLGLLVATVRLARSEGRRAYVEGER